MARGLTMPESNNRFLYVPFNLDTSTVFICESVQYMFLDTKSMAIPSGETRPAGTRYVCKALVSPAATYWRKGFSV